MKKVLLVIVLVLGMAAMFAQAKLDKGALQINAGIGLSSWGVPVYVGADYGIYELEGNLGYITAGGELSYRSWGNAGWKYTIFGIGVNGNYHFGELINMSPKVDTYAGLTLGYFIWDYPNDYYGSNYSNLNLAAQAGARYFFTDKLGVNVEAGGGSVSGLKLGITYKLK